MNIREGHAPEKPVSAVSIFKNERGNATAIRILPDEKLKGHTTPIPALLVCMEGQAIFENEQGLRETLMPGDCVHIEPLVKHWVEGILESHLILIK